MERLSLSDKLYCDGSQNPLSIPNAWASVVYQDGTDAVEKHQGLFADLKLSKNGIKSFAIVNFQGELGQGSRTKSEIPGGGRSPRYRVEILA